MKKVTRLFLLVACVTLLSGCAGVHEKYKESGWYAPDSFNYTLQRDRRTGDQSDYFGLGWSLK